MHDLLEWEAKVAGNLLPTGLTVANWTRADAVTFSKAEGYRANEQCDAIPRAHGPVPVNEGTRRDVRDSARGHEGRAVDRRWDRATASRRTATSESRERC